MQSKKGLPLYAVIFLPVVMLLYALYIFFVGLPYLAFRDLTDWWKKERAKR